MLYPFPYTIRARKGLDTREESCWNADDAKTYRDHYRRNGWLVTVIDHVGKEVGDVEIDEKARADVASSSQSGTNR